MNVSFISGFQLFVSPESLKSAILVSMLSVWVLIGLFTYLNRYTKRRYFTLWTVAWMFYGLWLCLNYGLLRFPENPWFLMFKQWCVGVSATFLLWGSFKFLKMRVRQVLLGLFIGFLLVWSYVGAFFLDEALYIQLPIFGLIGLASILTSFCFFQYRTQHSYIGAALLGFGFFLWGSYFISYPFFQKTVELSASGFFVSAVLQLFIAVSMIILVLEEVRHANQFAIQQIKSQKTEVRVLKTKVVSTEERYRSLFDQASEGILITSAADFRILELNATAQRLLGLTQTDAPRHCLQPFCQPGHTACIAPKGGAEWFNWVRRQPQMKIVRTNGEATLVEIEGALIQYDGRPAYQFFIREMTERSRLEQQLRQAEKLSALGRMISGVAHELNNPLAVIKGYLELVLTHHDLTPQTREDLQKVANESVRAAKLVRNFLAFSREQPAHRELINFNDIIERVSELRQFDLREFGVQLTLSLQPNLPLTFADPDQVQQVVNNLITNAVQAMEGQATPPRLRIVTAHKGENIELTLEDNGPGVPQDLQEKIYEPFFTTKEIGTGTGLGLSIAHTIMAEHRGRIQYRKSVLGGAAFILDFPIVIDEQPRPSVDTSAQPQPTSIRNVAPARILVLDDERAIAELLSEMLTTLGHKPTMCLDPRVALEVLSRQKFDLIISDFRMPGMNGQEFHNCVNRADPEMARRVIFLTGDIVNDETRAFLQANGNPHIAKPFQLTTLENVIGETLLKHVRIVTA